jgi:hypothetical protein
MVLGSVTLKINNQHTPWSSLAQYSVFSNFPATVTNARAPTHTYWACDAAGNEKFIWSSEVWKSGTIFALGFSVHEYMTVVRVSGHAA